MFNIPGTRGPYFRHRIQYQWAKYRLQKRLVARVMQALKEKHTPKHQEEEKNVQKHSRRVRFNLTPKAVDFVNIVCFLLLFRICGLFMTSNYV